MLNSYQIYKILKKDDFAKQNFKAVLPRDKLPTRTTYPASYAVNTHESSKKGEHWLALHYDYNGFCTFFDPFGLSPVYYKLDKFIRRTSRGGFIHNTQQLQALTSTVCGYYCIYFILMKSRDFLLDDILSLFDKKNFDNNDFKILHLLD
jgi:hypothetical protein